MEYNQRIKKARIELGLTQVMLAERTGLTSRTIQRLESGVVEPKAETIKAVADALGTTSDYILFGTEANASEKSVKMTDKKKLEELGKGVTALFEAGRLSQKDKDKFVDVIMQAYYIAKAKKEEKDN